jgi:hypothetical protein
MNNVVYIHNITHWARSSLESSSTLIEYNCKTSGLLVTIPKPRGRKSLEKVNRKEMTSGKKEIVVTSEESKIGFRDSSFLPAHDVF